MTGPMTLVLFGGTGDLAQKKLLPAVYDLYARGVLPADLTIVGFALEAYSQDEYRSFVREAIETQVADVNAETLTAFCSNLDYVSGDFGEQSGYAQLSQHLGDAGADETRLFYLAVPASLYATIFDHLAASGLCEPAGARLCIEKPFGHDTESAQHLDAKLGELFREEQVFRVDHYLGKDAIQNILTLRFTNLLFAGVWDAANIAWVHLCQREDFGVADRGSFYDATGALRDIGANHLMQMLALTAMESPGELAAEPVRRERAALLEALVPPEDAEHVAGTTYRAQYVGYRETDGVAADSTTETYFCVRAAIENERWRGVPFYLEHGKAVDGHDATITVQFREPVPCVCGEHAAGDAFHGHANRLTIHLQPQRGLTIRLWVRKPSLAFELEPQDLEFQYPAPGPDELRPDAYESVLYHALAGDQMLFASSREVAAAWRFVTPIVTGWQQGQPPLETYQPGERPPGCECIAA